MRAARSIQTQASLETALPGLAEKQLTLFLDKKISSVKEKIAFLEELRKMPEASSHIAESRLHHIRRKFFCFFWGFDNDLLDAARSQFGEFVSSNTPDHSKVWVGDVISLRFFRNLNNAKIRDTYLDERLDIYRALDALGDALKKEEKSPLVPLAQILFETVNRGDVVGIPQDLLMDALRKTTAVLSNPSLENITAYGEWSKQFTQLPLQTVQKKLSPLQRMGGIVLAFMGVLLIAASLYLNAVTFFAATPITVFAVKLTLVGMSIGCATATIASCSVAGGVLGFLGTELLTKNPGTEQARPPLAVAVNNFWNELESKAKAGASNSNGHTSTSRQAPARNSISA